jgi:DNA-directed RNA polymerase subunit M
MEFCPKCGARLIYPIRKPLALECLKCGYRNTSRVGERSNYRLSKMLMPNPRRITVLDREDLKLRTFPIVKIACPKCGKDMAEFWTVTLGSEGPSSITFFRCVVCGYTWREKG